MVIAREGHIFAYLVGDRVGRWKAGAGLVVLTIHVVESRVL